MTKKKEKKDKTKEQSFEELRGSLPVKERGKFVRFGSERHDLPTHFIRTHEGRVILDIIAISKREWGECWLDLVKVLLREMNFEDSNQ